MFVSPGNVSFFQYHPCQNGAWANVPEASRAAFAVLHPTWRVPWRWVKPDGFGCDPMDWWKHGHHENYAISSNIILMTSDSSVDLTTCCDQHLREKQNLASSENIYCSCISFRTYKAVHSNEVKQNEITLLLAYAMLTCSWMLFHCELWHISLHAWALVFRCSIITVWTYLPFLLCVVGSQLSSLWLAYAFAFHDASQSFDSMTWYRQGWNEPNGFSENMNGKQDLFCHWNPFCSFQCRQMIDSEFMSRWLLLSNKQSSNTVTQCHYH